MTPLGPTALEQLGDRMVPGHKRHKMGSWVLRADRGVTGRANSCWAAGASPRDFTADIVEVERWYASRSLPTVFQVFDGNDALVNALLDRGYRERSGALVMTASDLEVADSPAFRWSVAETPPESLFAFVGDEGRVVECTRTPLPIRIVTALHNEVPIGGGAVVVDGTIAGIGLMYTERSHRRQGVATAVLGGLAKEARLLGASSFWLQVSPQNRGAVELYRRVGFDIEHAYTYYSAPEPISAN